LLLAPFTQLVKFVHSECRRGVAVVANSIHKNSKSLNPEKELRMITTLGKELRKLRLDLGITLHQMATRSGVSPSLLSSAETGKKPASPALIERLAAQFEHVRQHKPHFLRLAEETKTDVRIRLSGDNQKANGVALAFARSFDSLTSQQIEQLMAVFDNSKKGT